LHIALQAAMRFRAELDVVTELDFGLMSRSASALSRAARDSACQARFRYRSSIRDVHLPLKLALSARLLTSAPRQGRWRLRPRDHVTAQMMFLGPNALSPPK
jgi:hypothetical protein